VATNFPTSLDALTNPTSASSLTSPDHAGQHADANDAIEALQAKVGVNSSAVTSSLDYKVGLIPGKNVVINGAMQVAQRSTSVTGITTIGYNTADRWAGGSSGAGTWTNAIVADAPSGSGFANSNKWTCTTAQASLSASAYAIFYQNIEGQNLQRFSFGSASATSVTLSFWVKSNVTGTYVVELYGPGSISASYTIASSGVWEKKTLTYVGNTATAIANNNASGLGVQFLLAAGTTFTSGGSLQTSWGSATNTRFYGQTNVAAATSNYWQITGVQVEAGAVATPFEFEDYGTTLAKCQRYYCRVYSAYLGTGMAYSTTSSIVNVFFPTTMRVAPSALETTGVAANYFQVISNTGTQVCNAVPAHNNPSTDYCAVTAVSASTGLVQGNATFILAATGAVYFGFSAEL